MAAIAPAAIVPAAIVVLVALPRWLIGRCLAAKANNDASRAVDKAAAVRSAARGGRVLVGPERDHLIP